jgi:hypothetical protein
MVFQFHILKAIGNLWELGYESDVSLKVDLASILVL